MDIVLHRFDIMSSLPFLILIKSQFLGPFGQSSILLFRSQGLWGMMKPMFEEYFRTELPPQRFLIEIKEGNFL